MATKQGVMDKVREVGAVEAMRRLDAFLSGVHDDDQDILAQTDRPVVDLSTIPENCRRSAVARISAAAKRPGFEPVCVIF